MKNRTLTVASLCLVVGLALVSANAQTTLEGKVPFNFTVSGKTFPAGEYTMIIKPHQLKIQDDRGKIVALVLANEVSRGSGSRRGQMLFHCYRDRCFLAEVWPVSEGDGRAVIASRAEADVAREEQGKYFAVLGEKAKRQ